MKNFTIYTIFICFFGLLCFPTTQLQAQIIEDDWNYTDDDTTLNAFPYLLKESLQPKVVVSPNPIGNSQISIWYNQLKDVSRIAIYDTAGRLYHTSSVGSSREQRGVYKMSASAFSPGLYIVKLKSGIYESVAKFIVR